tara:strand:- start:589 stop:804 length:216 start_codon:yes stop_codon:yes gene_type:complete
MKKRHFISLISTIKDSLHAHRMADWNDKKVIEIVAENITNKFSKYIKEQEDLERLGKTKEEFMIPPNGLNR